jgi:hypothetical protein
MAYRKNAKLRRMTRRRNAYRRTSGSGRYKLHGRGRFSLGAAGRQARRGYRALSRAGKTATGRAILNPLRQAARGYVRNQIAKSAATGALSRAGPFGPAAAVSANVIADSMLGGQGMYYGQRRLTGRGRYGAPLINDSNHMSTGHLFQPPKFTASSDAKSDEGGLILTNQEFIRNVYANESGVSFSQMAFDINPGLHETFPMLSQFAMNFEKYEMLQCCVHFESFLDSNTLQSSTGQVGQIMMYSHTNVTEPLFGNVSDFSIQGGTSAPVTKGLLCGVECSAKQLRGLQQVGLNYVRNGPVTGDIAEFDQAKVQVAVYNTPTEMSNAVMGRLHISYKVRLLKPRLYTLYGRSQIRDVFLSTQEKLILTADDISDRLLNAGNHSYSFGPNNDTALFHEVNSTSPTHPVFQKTQYSNMNCKLELQRPSISQADVETFLHLCTQSTTNEYSVMVGLLADLHVTKGDTSNAPNVYTSNQLKAQGYNYLVSKNIRAGPQEWRLTVPSHQQGLLCIEINFYAYYCGATDDSYFENTDDFLVNENDDAIGHIFKKEPMVLVERITKMLDCEIDQDKRSIAMDGLDVRNTNDTLMNNQLNFTIATKTAEYTADKTKMNKDNYLVYQAPKATFSLASEDTNRLFNGTREYESTTDNATHRLVGRFKTHIRVSTPEKSVDNSLIFTMPDVLQRFADDFHKAGAQYSQWNKQVEFQVSVIDDDNLPAGAAYSQNVKLDIQDDTFEDIVPGDGYDPVTKISNVETDQIPIVDTATWLSKRYKSPFTYELADVTATSPFEYSKSK